MNPILEELDSQIKDFGVELLEFHLINSDNTILVVNDVTFEDGKIKVELSPDHF